MDFGDDCTPSEPVPTVTLHGTSDRFEPFEGGVENAPFRSSLPTDLGGEYDELAVSANPILEPGVRDKVDAWAQRNGCDGDPTSAPASGDALRWEYSCGETGTVVLYEIPGGTHQWNIGSGFDTNDALWNFFSNHAG